MATLGVRSGSLSRSVAGAIPLNHAPWANASELTRTSAPNRQAGGHWFEPSTAHLEAPQKRGFLPAEACRSSWMLNWRKAYGKATAGPYPATPDGGNSS